MSAIRPILVFGLLCIALACLNSSGAHAADNNPDDTVKAGMAKLADAAHVYGNQDEMREQKLEGAIRLFLEQYTDVNYAARLIIANHWGAAMPQQRDRFVEAFNNQVTHLLARFVPNIDFEGIRIEPFHGDIEETPFVIRATFRTFEEETIHFDLVIHELNGRWLIFDVMVEGVSYVKTYRYQFSGEIADTGLDATIQRFEIRSIARGDR